jgi:uncharacterized membrane protein HdeD (DUF308 family)
LEVTERGQPVARLTPRPPEPLSELDRLIAEGRVILGTRNVADLGPPPAVDEDGPALSEILQAMRDEDDRRAGPRTPVVGRPRRPRFVVLVTAVRAALAFGIGAVLLLTPDQGTAAIAGFMGVYWLVSGLFSLAWARRGPFLRRMALVSGVVGVAAGTLVLAQRLGVVEILPPDLVLPAVGLVIGLTGVLHLMGGFLIGERIDRWPAGHLLLGLVELALAGVLLLAQARPGLMEAMAILWAFMSGSILAFDALRAHRRWSTPPRPDA